MSRFNLVIADVDEWYVESLGKYARSRYDNKFNLNMFTRKASLREFLTDDTCKADVLLINPEMFFDEIHECDIGIIIMLSDSKLPENYGKFPCIGKYQPGERILSEIINLYSGINYSGVEALIKGNKKTQIVSVYSPQGGSGKTVISINLAIQFARMDLKVFYLNLESVNSTNFFTDSSNDDIDGLSNILFHLKENEKSLMAKIDTFKSFDNRLGISFFKPASCALELDELTETDIDRLFSALKDMGRYDIIVVDMESVLNRCNMSVLNNSDTILLIIVQDALTVYKLNIFDSEIRKIITNCEHVLYDKTIPIINKYIRNSTFNDIHVNGSIINNKIPYLDGLYGMHNGVYAYNPDNCMSGYIKNISGSIIKSPEISSCEVRIK